MSWLFTSVGKVLEHQLQLSPSSEYLGYISFRIEWFDLLAVQGTLKSLLQHDKLMPQFEGIDSSALNLLYGPALTTIRDYWKSHRFDYREFCW